MLVLSMGLIFTAAPVAADEDEWDAYAIPELAADGDYFIDPAITDGVGPIARDIDGYFWAFAELGAGVDHIFKSLDTEGRTWETTGYNTDFPTGGAIVDIALSTIDADVAYVATVATVYKTENGGDDWDEVGDATLIGAIQYIAVGWDNDDDAVFDEEEPDDS